MKTVQESLDFLSAPMGAADIGAHVVYVLLLEANFDL